MTPPHKRTEPEPEYSPALPPPPAPQYAVYVQAPVSQTAAPGTTQTNTKSIVAGILAGLIAALTATGLAVQKDSDAGENVSRSELVTIALAGLVGSGLTGGATWKARNKAL